MHASGKAIAHLPSGKNIFVSGGIPGERVSLRRERKIRGYHSAVPREIIEASPWRVQPFCPEAATCGGCPWQHIAYEGQLQFKRALILDALQKYDIPFESSLLPPVLPSPRLSAYRNKAEYFFARENGRVMAGFHPQERPWETVACPSCGLLSEQVSRLVRTACLLAQESEMDLYDGRQGGLRLHSLLIRENTRGECCVCVGMQSGPEPEAGVQEIPRDLLRYMEALCRHCPEVLSWYFKIGDSFFHHKGPACLSEKLCGITFSFHPAAFFQPNPLQADNFYAQLCAWTEAQRKASAKQDFFIIDLYAGIGSIALCMAREGAVRVLGIEGNAQAVADAQAQARSMGVKGAQFINGDIIETFTRDFIRDLPRPDLIVLDPPRSGTLIEIQKTILWAHPRQIIYVSCNPLSLSWNLRQLLAGGYRLSALRAFDMFPHTPHVETLALLTQQPS